MQWPFRQIKIAKVFWNENDQMVTLCRYVRAMVAGRNPKAKDRGLPRAVAVILLFSGRRGLAIALKYLETLWLVVYYITGFWRKPKTLPNAQWYPPAPLCLRIKMLWASSARKHNYFLLFCACCQ